jgi:hypothetical protein
VSSQPTATSKSVNARMHEVEAALQSQLHTISGQRLPFLLLVQTGDVVQVRTDWSPVDGRVLLDAAVEWAATGLGGTLDQRTVDIPL